MHKTVYLPLLNVAFYLGNRLTKNALSNHLKILNIATSFDIKKLSSVHCLLSEYSHLKSETRKIWVCGHTLCDYILSTEKKGKDMAEKPTIKQPCGHNYIQNQRKDCYILHLPIEKQLAYFIEHHGLDTTNIVQTEDLNYRSDVNTGNIYMAKRRQNGISENTITLQLNMDGANCFKVSNIVVFFTEGCV